MGELIPFYAVYRDDHVADPEVMCPADLREFGNILHLAGKAIWLQTELLLLLDRQRPVLKVEAGIDARLAIPQVGPPPPRRQVDRQIDLLPTAVNRNLQILRASIDLVVSIQHVAVGPHRDAAPGGDA